MRGVLLLVTVAGEFCSLDSFLSPSEGSSEQVSASLNNFFARKSQLLGAKEEEKLLGDNDNHQRDCSLHLEGLIISRDKQRRNKGAPEAEMRKRCG